MYSQIQIWMLAGGGHDSLNALVRGDDIAPFTWSVRAFVPGDVREAQIHFAPDGRIIVDQEPRPVRAAHRRKGGNLLEPSRRVERRSRKGKHDVEKSASRARGVLRGVRVNGLGIAAGFHGAPPFGGVESQPPGQPMKSANPLRGNTLGPHPSISSKCHTPTARAEVRSISTSVVRPLPLSYLL